MTYTDHRRHTIAAASPDAALVTADRSEGHSRGVGRMSLLGVVLWVLLGLSAIGNTVASISGAGTGAHLLFGAISALSAITLGTPFLQARR